MRLGYLILIIVLTGCGYGPKASPVMHGRQECHEAGGEEFQYGMSGGSLHKVCVWRSK